MVAVTGCFLKLQIGGGGLHFVLQGARQFVGFAIEESRGFTYAVAVIFFANVADTRSGAAFDLVKQTRTVAVLEYAVFAGTQHKYFLQHLNAVAYGVAVGIRTEILIGLFQRAAVIRHLRILMAAEHQIRIAFIIAEKDIVFRRQGFDEVVFENQRFGFGTRDGGFDVVNLFYHQCDARRMVVFLKIAGNAPLEIDRFADIQNIIVFVKKTVHARQIGQIFQKKR